MTKPIPSRPTLVGAQALDAVASPARHELISALGEGPATVRELERQLGRSRQSLYYHLSVLVRVGLVRVKEWRGEGRNRERVYAVRGGRLAIGTRKSSRADVAAAERAIHATLRHTAREAVAALRREGASPSGPEPELYVLRGKARLGARQLRRLNALVGEIEAILQAGKRDSRGRRLYALTIALTPAREAGGHRTGRT